MTRTTAPALPVVTTSLPTSTQTGPLTTGPNVRPGEKPPQLVASARRDDATGALFFAGYYFESFDWAYATNDTRVLKTLFLPTCKSCEVAVTALNRVVAGGGALKMGRLTVSGAMIDPHKYQLTYDFAVNVTLSEQPVVIDMPSAAPSTAQPGVMNYHSLVFVRWVRGRWYAADVTSVR